MITLQIQLTEEEHKKITALAEKRRQTPEQCIRWMIRACQPDGGGWRPPSDKNPPSDLAWTGKSPISRPEDGEEKPNKDP